MTKQIVLPTEDDLQQIRELLEWKRSQPQNSRLRPPYADEVVHQAPEVYVAMIPDGGILGLLSVSQPVGTGTATEPVSTVNSALCDIYRAVPIGTSPPELHLIGRQLLIYNISTSDAAAGLTVVKRDKFGQWYVDSALDLCSIIQQIPVIQIPLTDSNGNDGCLTVPACWWDPNPCSVPGTGTGTGTMPDAPCDPIVPDTLPVQVKGPVVTLPVMMGKVSPTEVQASFTHPDLGGVSTLSYKWSYFSGVSRYSYFYTNTLTPGPITVVPVMLLSDCLPPPTIVPIDPPVTINPVTDPVCPGSPVSVTQPMTLCMTYDNAQWLSIWGPYITDTSVIPTRFPMTPLGDGSWTFSIEWADPSGSHAVIAGVFQIICDPTTHALIVGFTEFGFGIVGIIGVPIGFGGATGPLDNVTMWQSTAPGSGSSVMLLTGIVTTGGC